MKEGSLFIFKWFFDSGLLDIVLEVKGSLTHSENLILVPDITNPLDDEMFDLFSARL